MTDEKSESMEPEAENTSDLEEQSSQDLAGEEKDDFPARLKYSIGSKSIRAFSRECGFSDTVLRQYLSGQSEPTRPALLAIARTAGVELGWLVAGQGEPEQLISDLADEYECVEDESDILFAKTFIKKNFGNPKLLKQNYMPDDSMEPTICWGDAILIDAVQREPHAIGQGIYMMRLFNQILVKRVQRISQTQLKISSDSPFFESFIVEQEYLKQEESLLGRVIWCGRTLVRPLSTGQKLAK